MTTAPLRFVDTAPNWIDVGTPDIEGAKAFYRGLFGWQFVSAGPDAGGYGFFQLSGRTVAGGMQTPPEQGPPSWSVFFQTPDADATARAVERARGSVLVPPDDVPGQGRLAFFADESGVAFGVWQPAALGGLGMIRENGSLCWVELHTRDVAGAAGFYHTVFGWETSSADFPGGTYTRLSPAGTGDEGMFGGVVPLADDPVEPDADPHWLVYIAVDDADAVASRAERLGGAVRLAPTDIEGAGRIARLADPYGARFAVLRPAPTGY